MYIDILTLQKQTNNNNKTLIIDDTSIRDLHIYTKTSILFPTEKPDRLDSQIVQISARSVALTWKVLFDGNSPVMFFTVTHNISNGTMSYNVSKTRFKVPYLTPATFYNFWVTATNQLGTSDRSVVANTTLEAGTASFCNCHFNAYILYKL